uniref:tRNA (uracil(54)-C(5))-methyltransferase n=1 Tax=Cacopsylla melanoneura TaxID=428564 RepID=A0A8D9BF16_9HEMI
MADTSSPVEEGGATHGGGDLKRKLDETLTPGEREGNELGEKKIKEEEEKVESGGDGGGEGAKQQSEEKEKGDDACFAYSKRGDFTSEVFKIIVKGLPAFFGIGEVRKHFEVFLNVRVCKVIPVNRNPHRSRSKPGGVFVTFYDEATRQMALEKLNGYRYKGQVLTAVKANAMPDPFMVKMSREKSAEELKLQEETCTEEKLKDITIPLWKMTYDEQLEFKMTEIKQQINEMVAGIERNAPNLRSWFAAQRAKNDGLPVILEPIRRCEKPEGYRNKCEFSPGLHPQTKEKTFGFRFGKYSEGSVYVGSVHNLVQVPDRMKTMVRLFEEYVRESRYDIFDVVTQRGYWKLIMCRYAETEDELMVKIGFDPQDLKSEELNQVRAELKDYFENSEKGKSARATSVFFHLMPRRLPPGGTNPTVELLSGKPTISQRMFNLTFDISPGAFFQVNTAACHTLYDTVADLASLTSDTTLLDICSGVGTIGLCLASRCGEVIGVESSEDAVSDAALNARRNNIENATFHCGRAEHITSALLNKATHSNIVAVLDPPRAGIHHRLAATMRNSNLDRIVYLACDTKSVMQGFNGLTYAASKKFAKSPFVPVRIVPVDMFPYTKQVEWVILMQRFETLLTDY